MFWKWGGENIKIYGEGTLNGNGQRWWKYVLVPALAALNQLLLFVPTPTP
jgi:hypothetical protein